MDEPHENGIAWEIEDDEKGPHGTGRNVMENDGMDSMRMIGTHTRGTMRMMRKDPMGLVGTYVHQE